MKPSVAMNPLTKWRWSLYLFGRSPFSRIFFYFFFSPSSSAPSSETAGPRNVPCRSSPHLPPNTTPLPLEFTCVCECVWGSRASLSRQQLPSRVCELSSSSSFSPVGFFVFHWLPFFPVCDSLRDFSNDVYCWLARFVLWVSDDYYTHLSKTQSNLQSTKTWFIFCPTDVF